MGKRRLLVLGFLGTVASCASTGPSSFTARDRALADGLVSVQYTGQDTWSSSGIVVVHESSGAVYITRLRTDAVATIGPITRPRAVTSGDIDEGALESAVRGRLSLDPILAAAVIDVDTSGNLVRLAGDVATAEAAARAILIALDTPGARGVVARLSWAP